jgi:hypothetical protein
MASSDGGAMTGSALGPRTASMLGVRLFCFFISFIEARMPTSVKID